VALAGSSRFAPLLDRPARDQVDTLSIVARLSATDERLAERVAQTIPGEDIIDTL
jgi:hypothetical protein